MREREASIIRDWELFLLGVAAGLTIGILLGRMREERLASKHCDIFTNESMHIVCVEEFRSTR